MLSKLEKNGLEPFAAVSDISYYGLDAEKDAARQKKLNWRLEQTGSDEYFYEITPTNVVAPPTGAPTYRPAGERC
jgi:hypothetical protein